MLLRFLRHYWVWIAVPTLLVVLTAILLAVTREESSAPIGYAVF